MLLTMSIPMAFAAGAPSTVGTVADPGNYTTDYPNATAISSADQFATEIVKGGYFYLTQDIDFAGKTYSELSPASSVYLDGCGKTLLNIDIAGTGDFGFLRGFSGEIKNLNIGTETAPTKISVTGDAGKSAGFVRTLSGETTFRNVKIWVDYYTNNAQIGGFVGYANSTFNAINCEVNGVIDAADWVGGTPRNTGVAGFLGRTKQAVNISYCTNNAIIKGGKTPTAGFVGRSTKDTVIDNCVNNGNITTSAGHADATAAGIVAFYENSCTVSNCTNNGIIAGLRDAGGIVGGARGASYGVTITACTNTGAVSGGDKVGGILGEAANTLSLTNCTNSGTVTGSTDGTGEGGIGGLVGGTYNTSVSGTWTITGNTNSGVATNLVSTANVSALVGYAALSTYSDEGNTSTVNAVGTVGTADGMTQAFVQFSELDATTNTRSIRFIIALDEAALESVANMNLKVSVQQATIQEDVFNAETGALEDIVTVTSDVTVNFDTFGTLYRKLTADDISVVAAEGVVLYGLIITDVPEDVWNVLALELTATDADGAALEAVAFSGSYAR